MELYNLTQTVKTRITWKHVPAHSGIPGNEEADKLAIKPAKQVTESVSRASVQATEKSTDSSTLSQAPKVIVIQNNEVPISTTTKTVTINTTPKRIIAEDRSETPVPGCMNGASVTVKRKIRHTEALSEQTKAETNTSINKPLDAEHTMKIMTNIEIVLQSVVAEIHELRQEQQELKKGITGQIGEIQENQLNVEKSVSSLSLRSYLQV